jgi:hypothetical protein
MINNKTIAAIIFTLTTLISCNHLKKTVVLTTDDELNKSRGVEKYDSDMIEIYKVKSTIDSISDNYLKFTSFNAIFSGNYDNNNQNLPLKGIIKSEQNKFIWISVRPIMGIEVSRILITTDSVKVIDRVKSEYFITDYKYFKKQYGMDLNFKIIEAILFNKLFLYPTQNVYQNYNVVNIEETKLLSSTGIFNNVNQSHKISFSENYSIYKNELKFFEKMQSLIISYSDYDKINNTIFPNTVSIDVIDNKNTIKLLVSYKNIELNQPVSYQFEIPENFKPISFE